MLRALTLAAGLTLLAGCESAYYSAWEKVGVHKRDILVDRIEDTQEAQEDTQEQFQDALEKYRSVVNFDGGNLEKLYNQLKGEFEDSEAAAAKITARIDGVEDVAEDLFDEWQEELESYTSDRLRRDSASKLRDTRAQYKRLLSTMRRAEKSVAPVLNTLRDQTLYLKHNLNARAIDSLKGELKTIDADVGRLIYQMQQSIDQANQFINKIKQG
ncbi:DUF2959 domain-containing protein [Porticoccus sp. W117]|uniref:DUF2959 domain-containing protein n=1 Tax=Porticoccus sp. W117 TaxID=3054777 RepID=UPI0025997270|nr:DUF2959 domain-containing protein [Porticoccus sp. W117]MDM3870749.1 DUF2959 domain-containing protein [Porticoccus sp. W117]